MATELVLALVRVQPLRRAALGERAAYEHLSAANACL
jgi:hypothetical protein